MYSHRNVCICVRVHVCVYNALPQHKTGTFCYQVLVSHQRLLTTQSMHPT